MPFGMPFVTGTYYWQTISFVITFFHAQSMPILGIIGTVTYF